MLNKILYQGNHAAFVRKAMSSFAFLYDRTKIFHDNHFIGHKPDMCNCLLTTCLAGIVDGEDSAQSILQKVSMEGLIELASALIWIHIDGVYVIDATLQAELLRLPVNEQIPLFELGHMPEPCVYIQVPITIDNQKAYGFFAWLEYAFHDKKCSSSELIFAFYMMDGTIVSRFYSLKDQYSMHCDIFDANDRIKRLSEIIKQSIRHEIKPLSEDLIPLINFVLYLGIEQADIEKPLDSVRDDFHKYGPMNIWKVGYRIGNALRKHDNTCIENGHMKNKKPRPHIRNAHWHTYWTGSKGSKERCRVLIWVPFTSVGFSWEREETDIVRILK